MKEECTLAMDIKRLKKSIHIYFMVNRVIEKKSKYQTNAGNFKLN